MSRRLLLLVPVLALLGLPACSGSEPPAVQIDDVPRSAVSLLPHSPGGTVVMPRPTATVPLAPGETLPKPAVTRLEVPSPSCGGGSDARVTIHYETAGVDRVAILFDGRQVTQPPESPPVSGDYELTVPCDGRAHVVLLTGLSPDGQTAVDSRATTATPG